MNECSVYIAAGQQRNARLGERWRGWIGTVRAVWRLPPLLALAAPMGRHGLSASSLPEVAGAIPDPFPPELLWPFGRLHSLSRDELRESAYEIFFAACRSSHAAGTRLLSATPDHQRPGCGGRTPTRSEAAGSCGAKNMAVTSRLKRALSLRARKTRPMVGKTGGRPMTSAEIMRWQMGVTEQSDGRVRKTLVRSLVGP